MPKVSICVAVYNVEKYIEQCVRSLFGQTLDDLEYIFVDDASPDGSIDVMLRVLEDYPHRKYQVKLLRHEKNQGVAVTRKDAIAAATGDYIIHCDPDDWVELDMYEKLYVKALQTGADIVICQYFNETEYNRSLFYNTFYESGDLVESILTGSISDVLWDKLCKAQIVQHPEIKYFKELVTAEDFIAVLQYCTLACSVSFVDVPLYHYRVDNPESLMKNKDAMVIARAFDIAGAFLKTEAQRKISNQRKSTLLLRSIFIANEAIDEKTWQSLSKEIKKYFWKQKQYSLIFKMFFYLACVDYQLACSIYRKVKKIRDR